MGLSVDQFLRRQEKKNEQIRDVRLETAFARAITDHDRTESCELITVLASKEPTGCGFSPMQAGVKLPPARFLRGSTQFEHAYQRSHDNQKKGVSVVVRQFLGVACNPPLHLLGATRVLPLAGHDCIKEAWERHLNGLFDACY